MILCGQSVRIDKMRIGRTDRCRFLIHHIGKAVQTAPYVFRDQYRRIICRLHEQCMQCLIECHRISGRKPTERRTGFIDLYIFGCGQYGIQICILECYKCRHYLCQARRCELHIFVFSIDDPIFAKITQDS